MDRLPELRRWSVASALIVRDGRLLLVQNQRWNGRRDWTTPGGVVEEGEDTCEGLSREVLEETGLVIERYRCLAYKVSVHAPDLGWTLGVDVWETHSVINDVSVGEDPDGIVVDAAFVEQHRLQEYLDETPPWVSEPLMSWADARPAGLHNHSRAWTAETFSYELAGTRLDPSRVRRV